MKSKLIKMAISLAVFTGVSFAADDSLNLTVDKAIELALKNYPTIKQSAFDKEAAKARLDQKSAGCWPRLSIEGSFVNLEPDPYLEFPGFGTLQFFPEYNYDAHAALSYTIWDMGKTESTINLSKNMLVQSDYNIEFTKSNLSYQTVQVFFSIIFLQQEVNVQQKEIDSLTEYMNQTKSKVNIGSATDYDVLTIQVKVEEAKNDKVEFENMLNKQVLSLKKNIYLKDDEKDPVLEGKFLDEYYEIKEDEIVKLALNQRVEYKMSKQAEDIAKAELDVYRNSNNPSLDVAFDFGYKNGYFIDFTQIKQDYVIAANVSIPIFDGFRTANLEKEAEANMQSASLKTQDVYKSILTEIRQVISDVKTNFDKLNAAKLHVKLAEDAVEQSKVRFENGIITNLDLINAETSLAKARLLFSQAQYSYTISQYALKRAVGEHLWTDK